MRMFRFGLLLTFLALAVGGGLRADDKKDKDEEIKKDLAQLQGNWRMVRQDHEGTEDSSASAKKNGVLFDGKDYTFLRDGKTKVATATVTLDPTKDPKEIDLKITSGTASGNTQLGIYRITDEGKLEICLSQPRGKGSDKRPTKFTTKPSVGCGSILYVLEHEKE